MKFLCNFEWSSDHGHNMYLANGVWLIILLKNEWLIQSDKIKVNMTKNKSTTLTLYDLFVQVCTVILTASEWRLCPGYD